LLADAEGVGGRRDARRCKSVWWLLRFFRIRWHRRTGRWLGGHETSLIDGHGHATT